MTIYDVYIVITKERYYPWNARRNKDGKRLYRDTYNTQYSTANTSLSTILNSVTIKGKLESRMVTSSHCSTEAFGIAYRVSSHMPTPPTVTSFY